ncbi:MAG: NAD(P)H-binding protein [Xanthomonadales bacterium]|nr:NAD(P)H-binding protein [Xanthomonadales bacterium]
MRILLAGATGLVGGLLLDRLLDRAQRDDLHVLALGRRAVHVDHPRLRQSGLDGLGHAEWNPMPEGRPDVFLCCLGTTLRRAGSRAAFAAVDHDLVMALAGSARTAGVRQAIVVSSVGASARSTSFYLRVKGDTERDLAALGFARLDLIQPGLLLGPRDERRTGESLAQRVAPLTDLLMPGPLRRYRSIPAATVAAAMDALVGAAEPGRFVHRHDALRALADR